MTSTNHANLEDLVAHLRGELQTKKSLLLYAYNGTGKTRLSMAFKEAGKQGAEKDTLYFNAFTEDLFSWDNDFEGDSDRVLRVNTASRFLAGLETMEMESRIRQFLNRYVTYDFRIDYEQWTIRFSRDFQNETGTITHDNIKISRGEENLFVFCFFLAVAQLAMDGAEAYQWVKYVYIDDPISSLDENNAIAVAHHLARWVKESDGRLKTIISTHHPLFFNVLHNELGRSLKYFLSKTGDGYILRNQNEDTPFFLHVAMLADLFQAERNDRLYTYHFNMLRIVLEKSASFHGYKNFSACIKQDEDDPDGVLHARLINILSHGNYSLYEPVQMLEENKNYFKKIMDDFRNRYSFNPELFLEEPEGLATQ